MSESDFNREYMSEPIDCDIECDKCPWKGKHQYLRIHYSIEENHPLNKHLCRNNPDLHTTEFLQCPNCGRNLFADGKPLHRHSFKAEELK